MTSPSSQSVRVLDASEGVAAAIATRLLADAGAVVIRPSSPMADVDMRWRFRHRGKRISGLPLGRCLDAGNTFDFVVVDTMESLTTVQSAAATTTAVTFRLDQSSKSLLADGALPDYALAAQGGLTFITGDPSRSPLTPRDLTASNVVGLYGAVAIMASSLRRSAVSQVDIYARECVAIALEATLPIWFVEHRALRRSLRHELSWPTSAYRTADHWVGLTCGDLDETRRLLALLEVEGVLPSHIREVADIPDLDLRDAALAKAVENWNTDVLVEKCQSSGLAAARVSAPADVVSDSQSRHRRFVGRWVDGTTVLRAPFSECGAPRRTPPPPRHVDQLPRNRPKFVNGSEGSSRPPTWPLHGYRVVDFTWQLAGPFATMLLADLGADVIKVENFDHVDASRRTPPFIGGVDIEHSAYHRFFNRNKRSVEADFANPEDLSFLRHLVSDAALVAENFRPGSLDRKHLGYEELTGVSPLLSMCSISGFGRRGPKRNWKSYGAGVAECGAGLAMATGGDRPIVPARALGDILPGLASALTMCIQLRRAEVSKRGSYFEVTQFESVASTLDELVAIGPDPAETHVVVGSDSSGWVAHGDAGDWPVLDIGEVIASMEGNEFVQTVRNTDGNDTYVVFPGRFDGQRSSIYRCGPRLGQHTDEIQRALQ
jgi:crotonobetainyl-CoA:carnitine CoA-transferase CaiB-like acyl-CoA transferase